MSKSKSNDKVWGLTIKEFNRFSTLSKAIITCGYSKAEVKRRLGSTEDAFNKKLKNNRLFSINEIGLIATFLPLSEYQVIAEIVGMYEFRKMHFDPKFKYLKKISKLQLEFGDDKDMVPDIQERKLLKKDFSKKDLDADNLDFFEY